MSRDGGRVRKSRGRGRSEDEAFGAGGEWSPSPHSGHVATRHSGSGFGQDIQATVRWFNADKGFGFVELANGGGDAFLHSSALERAGSKRVEQGTTLRVRTGPGQKGLQVTEVLEVTGGPSLPRGPSHPRPWDSHPASPAHGDGEAVQGTVKWYDPAKGFGFVAPADGGRDVFVHATALERSGVRTLTEGQNVRMQVVQGRKGPEASTISSG